MGVTATVVPTSVTLSPVKRLKFGSCITGLVESRDLKLTNNSDTLNAVFKIQCPAHFKANPSKGTLKIGETQTTNIIFHPKQFGRLDGLLYIDIYSNSSEDTPPVHTHSLSLIGSGIISGGLRKTDSNKKDLASLTDLTHSIRPHDKRHEVMYVISKLMYSYKIRTYMYMYNFINLCVHVQYVSCCTCTVALYSITCTCIMSCIQQQWIKSDSLNIKCTCTCVIMYMYTCISIAVHPSLKSSGTRTLILTMPLQNKRL